MTTPPPLRVIIVDDEPLARERLRTLLADEHGVDVVAECGDGPAATSAIAALRPDLVFLDIQMPEMDGFEVLAAMPREALPRVIFVTAYDEHALRAFEVHATDYLLKPFDRARFATAFARARIEISRDRAAGAGAGPGVRSLLDELGTLGTRDRLVVRAAGGVLFLPFAEIRRAEAAGNYVNLYAIGGTHLVRETMASLEQRLDPARFVRISRSTIVGVDHVRSIRPEAHGDAVVTLDDGTAARVSRRYRARVETSLGSP